MANKGWRNRLTLILCVTLVASSCSGSSNESLPAEIPTENATSIPGGATPTSESLEGSESDAPPKTELQPDSVLSGVAVPRGNPALIESLETRVGADFSVIRLFARWNTQFPDSEHNEILDSGHRIHLSVRPRTDSRELIMWSDMASAQPGSATHDEMIVWADRLVALEPGSYFTLNHEPETRDSAANGNAQEFKAAWRSFVELVRLRGGNNVKMVWVMTGGAFGDGRADEWYPGDDVVDLISTDPYNWHTCQGTDRPWVSFSDLVDPALEFAQAHGKPLSVAEFASVEDKSQPGRKAEWINDAAAVLASEPYRSGIEYVAWFNVTSPGGTWPDCVWDYDTSPESADAFAAMIESLS